MKKVLSILFLLVYINTALGIGIDFHFCQSKIVDVKLAGLSHAHCNCPVGSMPKDCCKNELHFCQTDNHKTQADATLLTKISIIKMPLLFPDYISSFVIADYTSQKDQFYNYYRFKYKPTNQLFILNNVFRI